MNPVKVAVIGQGYVGLPISIAACNADFSVLGIDTDKVKIQKLASGKSGIEYIDDESLKNHISTGKYEPTSSYEKISECKIILICVPTPLTPDMQPDLSAVLNSIEAIAKNFLKDSLIIVESTVGPGTTRDLLLPLLEKYSGKSRSDFHLAFSPERIDPQNELWNLSNTPKLVAGLSAKAGILAKDFYEKFINEVVLVDTLEVAELAKLLENSFRLINISFINEISMFCRKFGVDINKVIAAASTKPYGFMPFYPSVGVGGHCIPVDPIYLATKAKEIGSPIEIINLASRINVEMPAYFVGRAEEILGDLEKKRVLVVGVSYKPNVADVRETPVKELIKGLLDKGANVSWHDELVKKWEGSESVALSSSYDLAILATPHDGVDLSKLGNTPILNTRSSI
jgi:UDP-N-acetyl-D-glucosamine dehydrogenase